MHDTGAAHEVDSEVGWTTIDRMIVHLAGRKGELDIEIARWLLVAQRERIDRRFGFGSFAEYVERRLGYDARTTHEKLRVARALEALPRLDEALRGGRRSWSAVREISRVATPQTEAAWIERTERLTVRQIEALVAGRKPGSSPSDPKDALVVTHRLVLELSADDLADWQEAAEHVRREIGPAANNREVLRALIYKELGQRPETQPGYQTTVTICIACERTWQQAGGETIEVPPSVGACAHCDGEVVGVTRIDEGIDEEAVHVGTDDETAHVGTDDETAHVGTDDETAHVGTDDETAHVGTDDETAYVGTDDETRVVELLRRVVHKRGGRALMRVMSHILGGPLKSMTPTLRAAVRARDRGRCIVPGCTLFRFIDLHHHKPRSAGGPHTLDNVLSVCSRHHRLVHDGVLAIEGSPSEGIVVRHVNGTLYGAPLPAGPALTTDRAHVSLHH